jgi:hypothetical protein
MTTAASVKPSVPSDAEELRECDALPSPYSAEQTRAMHLELAHCAQAFAAKAEAGEKLDAHMMLVDIALVIGKWSARAGRLYSHVRTQELREELSRQLVEALKRVAALESRMS